MEQLNEEQVAPHAYFIGERRQKLGTPGDQTSDWVQAERELLSEIKPKRRESNLSRDRTSRSDSPSWRLPRLEALTVLPKVARKNPGSQSAKGLSSFYEA
jgi:hypothetical protein